MFRKIFTSVRDGHFPRHCSSARRLSRSTSWRPRLEALEERCVPTWMVYLDPMGSMPRYLHAENHTATAQTGMLTYSPNATSFTDAPRTYQDNELDGIVIDSWSGGDSLSIQGSVKPVTLTLAAGDATSGNSISIGNGDLDAVAVPIDLSGHPDQDTDSLTVNDQNGMRGTTYTEQQSFSGAGSITLSRPPQSRFQLNYSGIRDGTLHMAPSAIVDTRTPSPDPHASISSDLVYMGNNPTFMVGQGSGGLNFPNNLHFLSLGVPGLIILDDTAVTLAPGYCTSADTIYRSNSGRITFSNMQSEELRIASGSTLNVLATPSGEPLTIIGTGNETINVGGDSNVGHIDGPLTLVNPDHTLTVNVDNSTDRTGHTATLRATSPTTDGIVGLAPAAINWASSDIRSLSIQGGGGGNIFNVVSTRPNYPVTLVTGPDNDTIKLSPAAVPGGLTLFGQGDDNTLDYSAYTTAVYANLQTSEATDVTGGIHNIQNVTGGQGSNILVGALFEGHQSILRGGNGRNLLIAGAGPGTLLGGSGEDILIGGTTNWDTDRAMLVSIMAQWTRTDLNYFQRTTLLGSTLNTGTVHANGFSNTLLGGPGLDWFFASTQDTTDWNGASGEILVQL